MSDDRSDVLARVRAALSGRRERKARPVFDSELLLSRHAASDASRVASFTRQLERVHGRVLRGVEALAAFLNEQRAFEGYVDATLLPLVAPALAHPFVLHREFVRSEVDTYAFAITRATGGIAETGSLIFSDASTSRRLAAIAPWIHVALVYESELFPHLPAALQALPEDPNVIFCTGPSKTADVEGILIEGVHGPGEQIALLLADP